MKRYLVTPDNYIDREWTKTEYETHNPQEPIIDKLTWIVCRHCGTPISVYRGTPKLMAPQYCDQCHKQGKYKIKKHWLADIDTKFRCLEFTEKEIDGKMCQWTQLY